jgi:hypothetical protein
MIWVGIIVGIIYSFVCFYLATDLDKRVYYAGITLSKKGLRRGCFLIFLWPITWFFPRLWDIDSFKI